MEMDGNGWKWMEMDGNGWKWCITQPCKTQLASRCCFGDLVIREEPIQCVVPCFTHGPSMNSRHLTFGRSCEHLSSRWIQRLKHLEFGHKSPMSARISQAMFKHSQMANLYMFLQQLRPKAHLENFGSCFEVLETSAIHVGISKPMVGQN